MGIKVLIATTTWWSQTARLALAFKSRGCDVYAICPIGSPIRTVSGLNGVLHYNPFLPIHSLKAAFAAVTPDLVVPCDDRVVGHLHRMHAEATSAEPADRQVRAVIEASLGHPASFPVMTSRAALLDHAAALGLPAPKTRRLTSPQDLEDWAVAEKLPWVIKTSGSWNGAGVRIVRSLAEARLVLRAFSAPFSAQKAFKALLVNHDAYWLRPWIGRHRAEIIVQAYVTGLPANVMAAFWKGKLLAAIAVEVVAAMSPTGSSTVVRVVERPDMLNVASRIAARLDLSGFHGLDFMIEQDTGRAMLVEMNPRATQLGHVVLENGRDLPGALLEAYSGVSAQAAAPVTGNALIAFFPTAWHADPSSPLIASAYHDVPWGQSALVRELMRPLWTQRSLLARLYARFRAKRMTVMAEAPARPKPVMAPELADARDLAA